MEQFRQQLEADEFFNMLKGRTLFRKIQLTELPFTTLEEVYRSVKVVELPQNDFLPSDPGDCIYEIISGYVKIYDRALSPAEKRGQEKKDTRALLAWRIPGELLGDFNFVAPNEKHSDQIQATDNCILLKVPFNTLRKLAEGYPHVYFNVASNLAAKAFKTRVRAQVLRLPSISCKIAKLFTEFLLERGYDKSIELPDGSTRVVNGTYHIEDIAAFLGYGYQGVQAGLKALIKKEKLLEHHQTQKSGRFVILDEDGLYKYILREQSKADRQSAASV